MSGLSWQTEDEAEQTSKAAPSGEKNANYRRLLVAGTGILSIAVLIIVYLQLAKQSQQDRDLVDIDVQAAYGSWRKSVLAADTEMLNAIVVGEDPSWLSTQRRLIETDLIFDRRGFGLLLQDRMDLPKVPQYELSKDWRWVTFSFTNTYHAAVPAGSESDVDLLSSIGFRREGSRWLYGQPDEKFWGEIITIELDNLIVEAPERDLNLAARIAGELDDELSAVCLEKLGSSCLTSSKVDLMLEYDPQILFDFQELDSVAFKGQSYYLPTPSLIGVPVDEKGYRLLYDFYSRTVVNAFSAELDVPLAYPKQHLEILCYGEFGRLPKLFSYDFEDSQWSRELSDRSFGFLSALAQDEGLLLQELPSDSGTVQLRLLTWVRGEDELLQDYQSSIVEAFPAGPLTTADQPVMLFRTVASQPENIRFNMLDSSSCEFPECEITTLDGFPTWSPDGNKTVIWQGGSLSLGDGKGRRIREIGEGFSPFWFDSEHFGYARFDKDKIVPEVEVVVGGENEEQSRKLLSSLDLARAAGIDAAVPLFIQYAEIHPGNPESLAIMARDYTGEDSRFYVFKALIDISEGRQEVENIELLGSFLGKPSDRPSAATPTGHAPLYFSPDGRMLTISRQSDSKQAWEIWVFNLLDGRSWLYKTRYPAPTFTNPYYDWSSDGEWVVIVDDGFLQLVAPNYDYRRYIRHEFPACGHVAWINS